MEHRRLFWCYGVPLAVPVMGALGAFALTLDRPGADEGPQVIHQAQPREYPIRLDFLSNHPSVAEQDLYLPLFGLLGLSPSSSGSNPESDAEADTSETRDAAAQAPASTDGEAGTGQQVRMRGGIIVLDFDLAEGGGAQDAINLSKPIFLNEEPLGKTVIRIVGEKDIYFRADVVDLVRTRETSKELAGLMELVGSGSGYISWDRLRDEGVTVSYDPVRDRVLLKS